MKVLGLLLAWWCVVSNAFVRRSVVVVPAHTEGAKVHASQWQGIRTKVVSRIPPSSRNSLASALAAAVVKLALQPFDTVKTLQQMERFDTGLVSTAVARISTNGIRSLWAGAGVTVLGSAVSTALYFGIFNAAKTRLCALFPGSKSRSLVVALSAVVGNTVACILRSPYEVLKSRVQVAKHPSLYAALTVLLREEGVAGLFGGGKLLSQIARDVPYAVLTGVCYEALQGLASRRRDHLSLQGLEPLVQGEDAVEIETGSDEGREGQSNVSAIVSAGRRSEGALGGKVLHDAICGGIAGGVGTLLTTPMDVVKTRLMSGRSEFGYASVGDAVRCIVAEEGAGALFRGTSSRLLHKIPANGLFYLFYEAFRSLLDVQEAYK